VAKLGPSLDAQTINEQKLFDNSLTCIKKLLIGPSAIGFNRRKLEDQRRKPAEEEAADMHRISGKRNLSGRTQILRHNLVCSHNRSCWGNGPYFGFVVLAFFTVRFCSGNDWGDILCWRFFFRDP
jgi:hypothetical protein